MKIDRRRATTAFAAYVRPYNSRDPKVRLKIEHTYRVAALCERIARSLALPPDETDLAWLSGLLHDVGRFEQLRRYGTFNDALSIDHAACSVSVLFDEGRIRAYLPDDAEDALLRRAVALHNVYRLPDGLDPRTLRLCRILRDADKVDILKVNVEVPMEDIYNVTTAELRGAAFTPAVLENFYRNTAILRPLKRTAADNVAGLISLVYELVYPESLRAVQEQGYLARLLQFASDNPQTAAQKAALRAHMEAWMAGRLA